MRSAAARLLPPLAGFGVLALVPVLLPDAFSVGVATMTFLWAAAALAWNVSGGYAGQLSLGHAAFYGLGAYASTLLFLRLGVSPIIGAVAGALLCALVAAALGAITLRLRGSFFVMATLAFGVVMHILAVNLTGVTNGTSGLSIPLRANVFNFVFANKVAYAYAALALLVMYYAISRGIEESRFGYALIAFREDDDAARALGVRTLRTRIAAFALSAAMTSLCGSFHAQYYLYIDPDGVVSLAFSLQVALIAIVGGLSTAYGPIFGALLITPLALIVQGYANQVSGLHIFVYSTIVILVLFALPQGVGPALARRFGGKKA